MQLLGVSFDDAAANAAFREKYGYPFPLLCDTERQLALAYGAATSATARAPKRITVVIDPEGRVQRVYESVNPLNHADQVLKDLGGTPPPGGPGILRRLFGR